MGGRSPAIRVLKVIQGVRVLSSVERSVGVEVIRGSNLSLSFNSSVCSVESQL